MAHFMQHFSSGGADNCIQLQFHFYPDGHTRQEYTIRVARNVRFPINVPVKCGTMHLVRLTDANDAPKYNVSSSADGGKEKHAPTTIYFYAFSVEECEEEYEWCASQKDFTIYQPYTTCGIK
jgi:hypothetical protein